MLIDSVAHAAYLGDAQSFIEQSIRKCAETDDTQTLDEFVYTALASRLRLNMLAQCAHQSSKQDCSLLVQSTHNSFDRAKSNTTKMLQQYAQASAEHYYEMIQVYASALPYNELQHFKDHIYHLLEQGYSWQEIADLIIR